MDIDILIVEDNNALRISIYELIKAAGYNSFMVPSAEKALKLLKRESINVAITDIKLPGIDGLKLTGLIKDSYDTDVIVMTGYSSSYSYEEVASRGASDFIIKPIRFNELLLRLKRVLKERHLRKEHASMLKRLQKLAITDDLTRLYNSRHFYSQLNSEIDRCIRYNRPLTLLLFDLDHFKQYNDAYGHLAGDRVLTAIGRIIKSCLRGMDTAYRYGGEEFTVILPETRSKEATVVADRIRTAIWAEKFIPEPEKVVHISVSVGITEYRPNEKISTLVHRADRAMYTSKQQGRNRIFLLVD